MASAWRERKEKAKYRTALKVLEVEDRSCGECKECCTAVGVPEIGKPYGVACKHLTDNGCGIYGKHPESCKSWYCMWRLKGLTPKWGDDLRPDRCKVVASLHETRHLEINETQPNAGKAFMKHALEACERLSLPGIYFYPYDQMPRTSYALDPTYNYQPNDVPGFGLSTAGLRNVVRRLNEAQHFSVTDAIKMEN